MEAGKIRIATHIEVTWLEPVFAPATCPNCATTAPARRYLDIDYRPPEAVHRFVLQICPHCTARFVDNTHSMDYGTAELIEIGWQSYQVQLGAGVWPIAAPLTRIVKPAGAKVLEIGGAYGFGLDFCVRARGWQGEGYDPSPLAAFGARELGLTIHQDYFTETELDRGPWDVVIATEVIEHLAQPPTFLRLLRRAIAPDGIVLLTTPDAEWITPALGAGALMPLLSPGAHLVLQTARSLELALRAAGFAHVTVMRDAMSLVAYASPAAFELDGDAEKARATYRRYLMERGLTTVPVSDLRLGFAGRGLFEAANDGDAATAEAAWRALLEAAGQRFLLNLATMQTLPPGAAAASLERLARKMPLGLGMILFGRAMHLLGQNTSRAALLPMLRLAGAAVAALQNALAQRSLTDGLSADIGNLIADEILLCEAEAGDTGCVAGFIATGSTVLAWRGFVALVNAGALALGDTLRQAMLPALPDATLPAALRRNALLSLANFYLAPGQETLRAFAVAEALHELGEDVEAVLLGGFTRLVNAGRYDEARGIAARHGVEALAHHGVEALARHGVEALARHGVEALAHHGVEALARHGVEAQNSARDARLALIVLALAGGDPAEVPRRLAGLALDPERREALLLEAFIRLVNAARYDEALAYAKTHAVGRLAARRADETGRNAKLARAVLDLAAGDPADIPRRLEGLEIDPERREGLLLEAFIRLVNAARYDEAVAYAATHEVARLAGRRDDETGKNARLAGTVLELAAGDPAEIPARLEGLELAPARQDVLLLEAFIRLVNASRFTAAGAFAQAHDVAGRARRQSGVVGANAALALAVLDLASGDPALVPTRFAGFEIAAGRREALLLGAFTGLVNAGRYDEAEFLRRGDGCFARLDAMPGEAADDARMAALMLDLQCGHTERAAKQIIDLAARGGDAAVLDRLLVDAFVRLVNEEKMPAARGLARNRAIERRLAGCALALRHDALAALLILEWQQGGAPERVPDRLEALIASGMEPDRLQALMATAFVTLVNAAEFAAARRLLPRVEPGLIKLQPPYDSQARNLLFAAGVLFLQEKDGWRRSAALLARLRDALIKLCPQGGAPDELFWPALRAEVLALQRLHRAPEASALLQNFTAAYPGAPGDLLALLETTKT